MVIDWEGHCLGVDCGIFSESAVCAAHDPPFSSFFPLAV